MRMKWVGLFGLLAVTSTFAATTSSAVPNVCAVQRTAIRNAYEEGRFNVSPAISRIMLAAINGDAVAMHAGLSVLPPSEAKLWRQEALDTAAHFGQLEVVTNLLNDGANPNAQVPMVRFKTSNSPTVLSPPALFGAFQCHDLAVTKLLLHHGADPNFHHEGQELLWWAVTSGSAPIVQAVLDAGADVCAAARRTADVRKKLHESPRPNVVADTAREENLGSALVQRLTCHAHSASD
jgi:ankyrin repeat protein